VQTQLLAVTIALLFVLGTYSSVITHATAKSGGHHNQQGSNNNNNGGGQQSGSNSGSSGSGMTITDNFQAGGGSNTPVGPVNVGNDNNNQGSSSASSTHKSKHSHITYPVGCGPGFDNSTCGGSSSVSAYNAIPTQANPNPSTGSNTGPSSQNQQGITNLLPPSSRASTGSVNASTTDCSNPKLGNAIPIKCLLGGGFSPIAGGSTSPPGNPTQQGLMSSANSQQSSPPVAKNAQSNPCITPAAYIVGIADTKPPCPKNPQTATSPPATDCTPLQHNTNPPIAVQQVIDGILGCGHSNVDSVEGVKQTHNPDGTVTNTEYYPNGISITVNPDGSSTTTFQRTTGQDSVSRDPDGKITSSSSTLGIDGSTTTWSQDGSTTSSFPNGMSQTTKPDGTVITKQPDGLVITKQPDGTVSTVRPDGSSITDKPDGTVITFNPSDGTTITAKPDGTKTTENKDGTWYIVYPKKPDGSISTYYSDGRTVTLMPDGRTITH